MTPDDFVSRLAGVNPKGRDKWMACCPAHDDRDPSLSVAVAPNGNILLRCWAGCSAHDVVSSLGLSLGDLFAHPLDSSPPMAFAQQERRQREAVESSVDHERMIIALAHSDRISGKKQSAEDKARELLAVRRLIAAGVEWDADIVHLGVCELGK